jgi:hypothetical protein
MERISNAPNIIRRTDGAKLLEARRLEVIAVNRHVDKPEAQALADDFSQFIEK